MLAKSKLLAFLNQKNLCDSANLLARLTGNGMFLGGEQSQRDYRFFYRGSRHEMSSTAESALHAFARFSQILSPV